MKNFCKVSGSRGTKKTFSIICGLREGYGEGKKLHSQDEAVEIALVWMKEKAATGKPFLTGTFSSGQVVYAWPEGEGKAGGGTEPVAVFSGEVSPLYNAGMTDPEVVQLLNELAGRLGNALGQTRVYVAYRDEIWILQAEESSTPTGN
jgi:hypothetical protein